MHRTAAPSPVASTSLQLRTPSQRCAHRNAFVSSRTHRQSNRAQLTVLAAWAPPTVADTKRAFVEKYPKPIPGIYSTVLNELLVQQHLVRHSIKYKYDEVYALGFVSVFDQIAEGLDEKLREPIFNAYIEALDEDPKQYRKDAEALEAWASGLSSADEVKADASGSLGQQVLAQVADNVASGKFCYSKFFAIGLFRLLELTGAKDPKALAGLVQAVGVRQDMVNRDLTTYKGVLSKLGAAKELAEEYIARERRKQAEREAEKKAAAQASGEGEAAKEAAPATEAA